MKKYFLLAAGFLLFNSFLYAELTKAQLWAISLTGIMTEVNNSNRNSLNTSAMDETGKNIWLEVLRRDWDINTREELLETLDRMEAGGHAASFGEIKDIHYEIMLAANEMAVREIINRVDWDHTKYSRFMYVSANWNSYYNRTIKAWDLGRNISLCRWGYNAGFITEQEAWEKIFHYAKIIQPLYNSWEEYGYDYFMGRLFWASGFGEAESYFLRTDPVYKRLMDSYWNWLDWHIDLDNEEEPPVNTISFLQPGDKDGVAQFISNDPALYDRFFYRYIQNPNPNPNIYECKVKKISGNDTYGYGIIFCVDDSNAGSISYYRLFITVHGSFAVAKRTGSTWAATPVSWRHSRLLNTGYNVYNTLRVERTDNEDNTNFKIFFNNNFVTEFNDSTPINGSKAGPVASINIKEMEQFHHIPVDVRFEY